MNRDTPLWRTASPLWRDAGPGVELDRPAILRFAGDDFMERLQEQLTAGAPDLADLLVAEETWRDPRAGPAGGAVPPTVRLYQPAHGRFYLVAAALVCLTHGLPEKRIDPTRDHSVFFVLRQLRPSAPGGAVDPGDPASYGEWAWVPEGNDGRWTPAPAGGLAPAEQRQPLFAMPYQDRSVPRRLLAGLVPVSARELLEAGPAQLPAPGDTSGDPMAPITDPRLGLLATVIGGLQSLDDVLDLRLQPPPGTTNPPPLDQLRESLYFALVELAAFLKEHLEAVWERRPGLPDAQQGLLNHLRTANGFRLGVHWLDALVAADTLGPGAATGMGVPAPVTGMDAAAIRSAIAGAGVQRVPPPAETTLFATVAAALPAATATSAPAAPTAAAAGPGAVYVIRCVFERPRCPEPERLRLSRPSRAFTLAPFHDPDAPFRPARIPTPVDTSLEGLRKHPKSVAVTISKQLRAQMERIEGIKLSDLDSGDVPAGDGVSLGMICQLSIPIITICALILLMIIVALLNIVFFWLPFFKICLPTMEAE